MDPAGLATLGLTKREAEVLAWVARGKTNEDTATILGARPATIAKHLEHIFRKLGVETRTAAAARALGVTNREGRDW
jgi:DNA-binding CsgD family transcriptional regulator